MQLNVAFANSKLFSWLDVYSTDGDDHIALHRQAPESKKVVDDYLGDMDLPSSESESEEEAAPVREEKKDTIRMAQVWFIAARHASMYQMISH